MTFFKPSLLAALVSGCLATSAAFTGVQAQTLNAIKERGQLVCGVSTCLLYTSDAADE